MVSTTKDFVALGRRAWARLARSHITMVLVPACAGLVFTLTIINWSYTTVVSLRDQTKKELYLGFRLADTQVNAVVNTQVSQLFHAVSSGKSTSDPSYGGVQFWNFDSQRNVLTLAGGSAVIQAVSHIEKTRTEFTANDTISTAWLQLEGKKRLPTDQAGLTQYVNLALFNSGNELGFTLPIVSSQGELKGIAFSSIPASSLSLLLPEGTYLVDPGTSTVLSQQPGHLTDLAKDKLMLGELVPNELFSASRLLQQPMANSTWKLWCDHSISEVWSKPEIKKALDFPAVLILAIWLAVAGLIQSSKRMRNRQRGLIGSLVRKIIWITDESGKIDFVLGRITSHLGWKEIDYLNVDISLFVHPADRETMSTAIAKAQAGASRDEIVEIRFENKDREFRWYEVTITNMMEVPEINGVVVTAHDIEQRKHATDHILASKRAAEKANEAKSEFLSRMSHELRTPLNAILGFGQLLEMEAISERQGENVEQILIAGRHLLNLVNDILDIARIETRKVNLSVEKVNIREVVEESFALLGPMASKSRITLEIAEGDCPDVWSDRQRLKQVILNLTSNGIKYNVEGGKVTLSCSTTEDGLKVAVTDTGIGIESHYLERVFTPFDRLGSDNSQVEGSGLGLALSKTLVEAMGATLEVHSEHGVGSVFTIHFKPSSIVHPEPEIEEQEFDTHLHSGGDFCILLIEDNVVNLRYVTKVVEKMHGVDLISAKEGGIGIEMARSHNPDLILLDLDLPDLHGKDVLQTLRSDEKTANMRIVVMSAETNPSIVEEVLFLGADQFVTKPVDVNSLIGLFTEERNAA